MIGIKNRDGAFAEFISLPVRNLVSVPDSLPDEVAVFAEPLAAACQILEQVPIISSTSVVIIGDGKLAQAVIRVIAQTGCVPTVIGKHEHKLDLASSAGARCVQINGTGSDLAGLVADLNQPDVVIEASGSPTGLPLALSLVKPGGVIVLKSTHQAETALALSQVVVNEVTIIGSRCGRLSVAVELLASGKVGMSPLISAQFPLDEGLKAFETAARPDTMKVLLRVAH